jgi:UDP-2,3-diacylglucosamine hydrolase
MHTVFISDLHLEDARTEVTGILRQFLRGPAREAAALYILGDLFEFWIGDDVLTETAQTVAAELRALREQDVRVYFVHGNRDFLIGPEYARLTGMELLPATSVVDLYGTPSLLLHGDALCTDDEEYQAFRRKVRDPSFQRMFLGLPPSQRLAMVSNARDASKAHTGSASMEIMDVNARAVEQAFTDHGVQRMIHGHTHRPAVHQHALAGGGTGTRVVLSDWFRHGVGNERGHGSYLRVDAHGLQQLPLGA